MAVSLSGECQLQGPPALISALLKFQREGVEFGIRKHGRCLIGDEMGLGKTLQALTIACHYRDEWPLLIVVPSSVKFSWIEEIEKWLPDINPRNINLIRSGTDVSNIGSSEISLVSYGLFGRRRSSTLLLNCLKEQQFKVMIIDESHYLKNRLTDRTKCLYPLAKKANRIILLSGTPSLARPEELYIQLDIVNPGLFGSFSKFANEYCEAHMEYLFGGKVRKWNTRGASNLDKLHNILKEHVMIRRLKKEVLTQLPPKRRQKVTFDVSDSDYKKDLDKVMKEFRYYQNMAKSNKESEENATKSPVFELKKLSCQLYHYTGLAKAAAVQHYITDLLDGMENKFLVFCRHHLVMKAVQETLTKKKTHYIRIAGDVPSGVRGELVHRFQSDPKTRVALLSLEAASYGITLTAADHVVFAELHYTPGMMMQAEDRAHRIGQENAVNVHYLVARGTIDEMLWSMLCRKVSVTSSALDGKLQMLTAEVGDEEKAKEMATCSAWVPMDDSEVAIEEEFLFPVVQKKSKRDRNQSDLRTFFSTAKESKNDSLVNHSHSPYSQRNKTESTPNGESTRKRKNSDIIITDASSDDEVLEVGCSFLETSSMTRQNSKEEGKKDATCVFGKEEPGDVSSPQSSGTSSLQHCIMSGQDLPQATGSSVQELNKIRGSEGEPEQKRKESVKSVDELWKVCETECGKPLPTHDKKITDKERLLSKTLPPPVLASLGESQELRCPTSFRESSIKTPTRNGANKTKIVLTDESDGRIPNSLTAAIKATPRKSNARELDSGSSYGFSSQSLGKKCLSHNLRSHPTPPSPEMVVKTTIKSPCLSSRIHSDVGDGDDFQRVKPVRIYSETVSHNRNAKRLQSPKYQEKSVSQERVDIKSEIAENSIQVSHPGTFGKENNGYKSVKIKNIEETLPEWACSACTFLNDPQMIECSLCFTPRRRSERHISHKIRGATKDTDQGNSWRQSFCTKRKRRKQLYENDTQNGGGISQHVEAFVGIKAEQKGDILTTEASNKRNVWRKNNGNGPTQERCKAANKCDVQMQKDDSNEPFTKSEQVQEWLSEVTTVLETSDEDYNSSFSSLCNEETTEDEDCFVPRKRLKVHKNSQASPLTISEFSSDEESSLIDKSLVTPETAVIDESTNNVKKEPKDELLLSNEAKSMTKEEAILSEMLNTSEEWMQDDDYWQCEKCDSYNFEDESCSQCNLPRNESKDSFCVSQNSNGLLKDRGMEEWLKESDLELQSSCQSSTATDNSSAGVVSCGKQSLMDMNGVTDQSLTGGNPYLCVQPQKSSAELIQPQATLPDGSEVSKPTVNIHKDTEPPEEMILQFSMSRYTDRVYLYDEDGKVLNINFLMSHVENRNMEELPALFSVESNFRQALKLVREWKSLGEGKKRVVCKSGLIFSSAITAYENEKINQKQKPSFIRHSTKEMRLKKVRNAASEVQGDVRVVTRPPNRNKTTSPGNKERLAPSDQLSCSEGSTPSMKSPSATAEHTNIQAVRRDGVPLCLYCLGPVTHANLGTAWEARFCSYKCKEEHEVRVSGSSVRRKLYEEEQGICQMCGVDAHALYQSIKSLPVKERCTFLAKSSYASIPARMLNRMITEPKEGMFWEADHITPVAEGGGQCGLDNYRTLCIPCHRTATAQLNRRLKQRKMRKSGYGSITDFFGP